MMDTDQFTENAVQVYRDCSLVPTVLAARILTAAGRDGSYEVEARWSQREFERGKKLTYPKSYFVERKGSCLENFCATTFQADATKVVKVAYASECCVKAVLVKDKPAKAEESAKPQQYIEVWNGSVLTKTIAADDLKKHGTINEDSHFGSFQLSPDGRQLLYIAEKEKPKTSSFFKKQPPSKEDTPVIKGAEYVYETNWGEQLSTVVNPLPVVLTLETEECAVIDTIKLGDISAGQAQWVPGEEGGLVFVGWENKPIKLGFIYCLNRRSALYYANIKTGECTALTDNEHTVFNPRFNLQGERLVYFQALAGGPHHTCAALKMIEWPSKTISTVIDIVKRPATPEEFPGFYAVFLPERCWNSSGDKVVFSDSWGSYLEVNCIDVMERRVTKISGTERKGAWSVLDVSYDLVVAQFADVTTPPQLYIGAIPDNPDGSVTWTQIAATETALTAGMKWDVTTHHTDDGLYYQSILLTPPAPSSAPSAPPPPLAVLPHGGPHVVYPADFMAWPVSLAALGFAVLMINYRGSAGFGQDNVFCLPGKAGTQDVRDIQDAAEAVVKKGLADKERVVVFGGSHGGFLTTHLIGQFPDFYKAACVRNPVTDLTSKPTTSDIPLWSFVEAGAHYDSANPRTSKGLATLLKCSPITLAEKIKAPVLICLGSDDLRVPTQQGLLLYNTLKAQGKETKVLMYPGDTHPINSVYSDADCFVNTAAWLYRYSCC